MKYSLGALAATVAVLLTAPLHGAAQRDFADVSKGYSKIQTAPGESSLYGLWIDRKNNQLLAEFPRGWEKKKFLVASTPSQGQVFAGLQGPARYVYWKRFGDRMALIEPELDVRSTGGKASQESVNRIFTDRVIVDVPIVSTGPSGQPVIDLDSLLISNGSKLGGSSLNRSLATISKAKAFPKNVEIEIEAPDSGGTFRAVHYSISEVPGRSDYQPREADDRVGYFMTSWRDLGLYGTDTNWKRYINRWNLKKRDPSLRLSPPVRPIVFHIEHTVPVRYRRYVREGIEMWNEAFERIGIDNAIVVIQQDEADPASMKLDPEDVRYNFVRWLNNDVATAIGPSRAHPETGEILDADIILTDGWIRAFYRWFEERPGELAMSLDTDALVWLEDEPQWDPRVMMLPLEGREQLLAERAAREAAGDPDPADSRKPWGQIAEPALAAATSGDDFSMDHDHRLCLAARGLAMDMAFASVCLYAQGVLGSAAEGGDSEQVEMLDGVPEWFVGPHLRELVAHEVGHTLGLRHNFKASSLYTLAEINSEELKGQQPLASSVMDYLPTNFNADPESIQGDYSMIAVGPYDLWAIEYGYTFDDPKKVLARVGEPEHIYLTDEDTTGPDPLARRYDFSKNPIDYARSQMALVRDLRARLLSDYVKDGDSWERARKGYLITLRKQRQMIDMMANWIGGTHVARVKKGDPNTGDPLVPVDPDRQREALQFMIESAFEDDAYALSPDLLSKMTLERWGRRAGGMSGSSAWPIHDEVANVQRTALTMLYNPSRLGMIRDNEFRTSADQDALTLPEVFAATDAAIFSELRGDMDGPYSERDPMISSLRRMLQADMTDRLIAMANGSARFSQSTRQLALMYLADLDAELEAILDEGDELGLDTYSRAHLHDLHTRTSRALDAVYIVQ